MNLFYRGVRFLNRHITFTPEFRQKISREVFIESARNYLDYPYVLGADGSSKSVGIDCSHLISRALIDTGCMRQHFYRIARYLEKLTETVKIHGEIQSGDLLFLWDESGTIGHVAIILRVLGDEKFEILDASGPSTGIYSTTIREISLSGAKHIIGRPYFLI